MISLIQFLIESDAIEGVKRIIQTPELQCAEAILELDEVTIAWLRTYVQMVEPDAMLRDRPYRNVTVGDYRPPSGGPGVEDALTLHLDQINNWHKCRLSASMRDSWAHGRHIDFEKLHPFTDGNGRAGRLLWLRAMGGLPWLDKQPLDQNVFLQWFYYQTLASAE